MVYSIILIRKNGVLSVYDYNMQKKAELSGADVTTLFDGTLRIGENMTAPKLGSNEKFKGKVFECKVYNRALTSTEIETLYPNIYSNEYRTKGAVAFKIPNAKNRVYNMTHVFLDMTVDMGEYGTPEYAGKYPKAVGVKLWNEDDVLWIGTGSNGHLSTAFYTLKTIKPFKNYTVEVVNTGLAPGLECKIENFRCLLLGAEEQVADSVDALDFEMEWDKEELTVKAGETLTGKASYIPDGANTGTELTAETDETIATAVFADGILTVSGAAAGETSLVLTLPSGARKEYVITVTEG